jgi:hypothetical protein
VSQNAAALFAKAGPGAAAVYGALIKALKPLGRVGVEVKTASVHLTGAKSAFAGGHPRKTGVLLNIRTKTKIASKRIRKVEQVSANRFHNELLLTSPADIDAELLSWLSEAYDLSR